MAFPHYATGGPAIACCAWCGQSFSASNFHHQGSWTVAVKGSVVFKSTGRSGGGRQRPMEAYFVSRLVPLPAARRLSPWPTSRRVCSEGCLQRARAYEQASLDEMDDGGAISRTTKPARPFSQTDSPARAGMSPTFGQRSLSPATYVASPDATTALSPILDSTMDRACKETAGRWLGVLKVKVEEGKGLITHEVGEAAELNASDSLVVVAFNRSQRSTGLVKAAVNPKYGDELLFDVYEEDVPVGFMASPDRRERKRNENSGMALIQDELRLEKRQRASQLRRVRGQRRRSRPSVLFTTGIDLRESEVPWEQLCVEPGPDDCTVKICVFRKEKSEKDPTLPLSMLSSLGNCSISALELVRNPTQGLRRVTGRLTHPDPRMVARGIVIISMNFEPAEKCGTLQPQEEAGSKLGMWQRHEAAGTHPRPASRTIASASGKAGAKQEGRRSTSLSPDKLTRAFKQIHLQEDLPWKRVEHVTECKIRVHSWDKVVFLSACPWPACLLLPVFLPLLVELLRARFCHSFYESYACLAPHRCLRRTLGGSRST